MKRKITRASLENLSKELPVLGEHEQRSLLGGGMGTEMDPYGMDEYNRMVASGTWEGGYVEVGSSYWDNHPGGSGTTEGNRMRGVAYVEASKGTHSYDQFEKMVAVGAWKGGLVIMRDGTKQYLGKDAKDDDGIINITGNRNIDFMFTQGYKMGYAAGVTPSQWDDAYVIGTGVVEMSIAGTDSGSKSESDWMEWYYGHGKLRGTLDGRNAK